MKDLKEFLESTVNFEVAGYDKRQNTLENAARQLHKEAIEFDRRQKSLNNKFAEALQGLPSYINIPFYNFDIINLMKALGIESNNTSTSSIDNFKTTTYTINEERTVEKFWFQCGLILEHAFNPVIEEI